MDPNTLRFPSFKHRTTNKVPRLLPWATPLSLSFLSDVYFLFLTIKVNFIKRLAKTVPLTVTMDFPTVRQLYDAIVYGTVPEISEEANQHQVNTPIRKRSTPNQKATRQDQVNTPTRKRCTPNHKATSRKKKIATLQMENVSLKNTISELEDRYDRLEQTTPIHQPNNKQSSPDSGDTDYIVTAGEEKLREYIDQFKTVETYRDRDLVDEILDDISRMLRRVKTGTEMDRLCMSGQISYLDSYARDVGDGEEGEWQVALLEGRWISMYRALVNAGV
ncbi:hypothetical protein Vi05172_g8832 [Venturia inaequalis]|nr:hypothetical protein Vi05172_g8832 [Venturia inaequalis]